MGASVGNILLKNGLTAILNIVFTNMDSNLTPGTIQCVANNFEPYKSPTILIAIRNNKEVGPLTLPNWSSCTNKTFIVINEAYDKHLSETNYRANFGVAVTDCQESGTQWLQAMKKTRLISVRMKLVVYLSPLCRNDSHEEVANSQLSIVHKFLNPAYTMVVSADNSFKTCWSRPTGRVKKQHCGFFEEEIFMGHTLRVVADAQDPYVLPPEGNGTIFTEGIEIKIIHEIAKRMGKTFVWVKVPAGEPTRVLKNKKGEYSGIMGVLHRLEADVGFAGITLIPERVNVVEFLPSHTDDALKWFIPAAPKVQNLGAVVSVFSGRIWGLVIIVFTCFGVTLAWILHYSSTSHNYCLALSDSFTQTMAIVFDQCVTNSTSHFVLPFILLCYMMYCLIITNAYRSSLITALTSDYEGKWYETAEEYIADGGVAYLMISGKTIYEEAAKNEPIWKKILKPKRHVYVFSYSILIDLAANKSGMVLGSHNPCNTVILKNLMGPNMKPKMIMLKEKFMRFPVAIYMAPGSPLYPALHKRIVWLMEAGLVKYWLEELNHRATLGAYRTSNVVDDEGPQSLTLGHLELVFLALMLGLVLSFIVFVTEVFYIVKPFKKLCSCFGKHSFNRIDSKKSHN